MPSGGRHPLATAAAIAPGKAPVVGGGLRTGPGRAGVGHVGGDGHWLPVFFIPGQGGTTVRYCVLISATAMFVLSAVLLHAGQRGPAPVYLLVRAGPAVCWRWGCSAS